MILDYFIKKRAFNIAMYINATNIKNNLHST